jgi:hypothetical protein
MQKKLLFTLGGHVHPGALRAVLEIEFGFELPHLVICWHWHRAGSGVGMGVSIGTRRHLASSGHTWQHRLPSEARVRTIPTLWNVPTMLMEEAADMNELTTFAMCCGWTLTTSIRFTLAICRLVMPNVDTSSGWS